MENPNSRDETPPLTPPRSRPTPTTPPPAPRLRRSAARRGRLTPSCEESWRRFLFPHVGPEEWELWLSTLTPPIRLQDDQPLVWNLRRSSVPDRRPDDQPWQPSEWSSPQRL